SESSCLQRWNAFSGGFGRLSVEPEGKVKVPAASGRGRDTQKCTLPSNSRHPESLESEFSV
ncbi:MAG: hypothetical protein AAF802_25170, partial [Planctomycetota bacterium]